MYSICYTRVGAQETTEILKAIKRLMDTARVNVILFQTSFLSGSVMITSGESKNSAVKTEVVDVVNGKKCSDLAAFPYSNRRDVAANLQGTPVVCGSKGCFKFINDRWQKFASMKERRYSAAGIVHKNKFHIFGGDHITTELISIDGGVEYGPELPESVYSQAITSINSTVSLLSGPSTTT